MKRFRMAVAIAAAVTGLGVSAENVYRSEPVVAHWVGISSRNWNDPANWSIEGIESHPEWEGRVVPGVFTNESHVAEYGNMGHKSDQAIFDTPTAVTNIYLTGMVAISNITFRGAALPQFRFSSGPLQMIQGSVLKVEEDVPLAPILNGGLAIGTYAVQENGNFTLWNDSPTEVKVNYVWGLVYNDPDGGYAGSGGTTCILAGRGDVRFNYNFGGGQCSGVFIESRQTGEGKVIFSSPWAPFLKSLVVDRPDRSLQRIQLCTPEDPRYQDCAKFPGGLRFAAGGDTAVWVKNGNRLQIEGEDGRCLKFFSYAGKMDRVFVEDDAHLHVDAEVTCDVAEGATPAHGLAPVKQSSGTVRLTNARNAFTGEPDLQNGIWETATMGVAGAAGPLGKASRFLCSGSGKLRYVGTGETTTRGIRCASKSGIILDNAGTGDLFFDSDVLCEDTSGTTVLQVSSSSGHRIVFNGPIAADGSNLKVQVLAGKLGLTGANGHAGGTSVSAGQELELHGSGALASAVELAGDATVRVVGDAAGTVVRTLPVDVKSGCGRLHVTGRADVTLSSLTIAGGATLRIYTDEPQTQVSIAGMTSSDAVPANVSINGCAPTAFDDNGTLVCENTPAGDVDVTYDGPFRYVLSGACSYTGKTILDGSRGGAIYAMLPGSIPNYGKVEATGGDVIVPVAAPDGSTAWSDADILSLANDGRFEQGAVVSVDTTKSGDHTIALSEASVVGPTFGIGASGTNRLTLTGSSPKEMNFAARSGTLEFMDADVTLGTGLVTADMAGQGNAGTVIFDRTTARLAGSEDVISVGGRWAKSPGITSAEKRELVGRLVIKDSTLVNVSPATAADVKTLNFAVGGYQTAGRGIVEISGESTVVTAQICVASTAYGDGAAVYQRGGRVVNRLGTDQGITARPLIAYMGSGEWNLFGGSYTSVGTAYWAANQSMLDAFFMQYGGTSRFEPNGAGNFFAMGCGNGVNASSLDGGRSHLYVAGGSCMITNMTLQVPANGYRFGYAELVADGPSSSISLVDVNGRYGLTEGSRMCFTLNNGGLLEFSDSIFNYYESIRSEVFFNVNGGRIRSIKKRRLSLGLVEEGRHSGRITVFEKGIEFDTNDGSDITVRFPIVKPTGKGVKSIVLKKSASGFMSPVGAPGLLVSGGGGDGATALAQFDPETRSVTNVIVTCPGWGYAAEPDVSVRYACERSYSHLEKVELTDLVGGGLTKVGGATLTLDATNSYAGATVVKEGTLAAGCDGAIPDGNALVLAGGNLDLSGHAVSIGSMTLKGAGLVLNAGSANWPADWSVDISETPGYTFESSLAFPEGATLTVANPGMLANRRSLTLFTLNGGFTGELPELVGMDANWRLRLSGKRLRLDRHHGTVLVVR